VQNNLHPSLEIQVNQPLMNDTADGLLRQTRAVMRKQTRTIVSRMQKLAERRNKCSILAVQYRKQVTFSKSGHHGGLYRNAD
jgi:hypothetical protein